jgi:photosystem II stability/assembly factor-like uncharacterized protein
MNKNIILKSFGFVITLFLCYNTSFAQKISTWDSVNYSGINLRSIGPGFMSGRIADVAIDPTNENHWYVGAGSGGVWETHNAGISFKPIFDGQKVYSIGCITIDPNNTKTVWVGTGENVGGRHASIGDGIYKSENGGSSWVNMGLTKSEHISKIIVHPSNPEIIWVAVQGPLWSSGGERGVYRTENGGKKWKRVLGDSEWTGATDLMIDPRNPDVIYAATWQRHRTVAAYMGGGPKSGIHKSTDGGITWQKLRSGLPNSNMGKIGIAISPMKPDVIYAAIELDQRTGGVYRSENQGATWTKMSNHVGGATGPHYYQELWASPHNFDEIYLANIYLLHSKDGGKTFNRIQKRNKHVDNHTVSFKASDPHYLLVGSDGGLYETLDDAKNWRHFGNLPLTQYYKLALDDAEPFYHIFGGTQDNNSQRGPSRTDNRAGIPDGLWQNVLGGDGHQPATEPGNPNIAYVQIQQGVYNRLDVKTGERVGIQPQPKEGDAHERYNWDAPILVSPHAPTQIYVGSQRLWRSNDRGDTWEALSNDLTRNEERFDLPIMGRKQSFDNAWDVYAMSTFNTITAISESPIQRDLIYVGTDDGLIQITANGGKNWRTIDVGTLPGAPKRAYVNDLKADLHDANKVYLCLDNHKSGDYKPYVYVSDNKGKSWNSISSNLSDNDYVWRIVQDHKNKNLLFLGTEFGLYFTINGGVHWNKLTTGLPTISFRDLAIQKREDDLVAASFGRGFYILDDLSFLRELNDSILESEATLFSLRDADLFVQRNNGRGNNSSLGIDRFVGNNPLYGAVFTYFVSEEYTTASSIRKKEEAACNKEQRDIDFPGWDALEAEKNESVVSYWLVIKDESGAIMSRQKVSKGKGFHRVSWNLRRIMPMPVSKSASLGANVPRGFYVPEGQYQAVLVKSYQGVLTPLGEAVRFEVKLLHQPSIPYVSTETKEAYYTSYIEAVGNRNNLNFRLNENSRLIKAIEVSTLNASGDISQQLLALEKVKTQLQKVKISMRGYSTKNQVGEKNNPSLNSRIGAAGAPINGSMYGPTSTAKENLELAQKQIIKLKEEFDGIEAKIQKMVDALPSIGAQPIQGVK